MFVQTVFLEVGVICPVDLLLAYFPTVDLLLAYFPNSLFLRPQVKREVRQLAQTAPKEMFVQTVFLEVGVFCPVDLLLAYFKSGPALSSQRRGGFTYPPRSRFTNSPFFL